MSNPNFDTIATTTLQHYSGTMTDNVFNAQPYLFWISQGATARDYPGGRTIVEEMMIAENSTVGTYDGYDVLSTTPQDGMSAAEFPLRQAAGTIAISGREIRLNSGSPEKVHDLLANKTMQCEKSLVKLMNTQLLTSDGTGNSNKDWLGLEILIGNEFIQPSVGGIDGSNALNQYWRANIDDNGNAASLDAAGPGTADRALTLDLMRSMYYNCTDGSDQPDVIFTSRAQYQNYEALMQPQQQFVAGSAFADAGFTTLHFHGTPVVYDNQIADDRMYFLNADYLWLRPDRSAWFLPTPQNRPHNQDAFFSNILLMGNQTISSRRRQGLITKLTV